MTRQQDQPQRDLFANEICENFSVIAQAGVGKTTAITCRIANIIIHDIENSHNADFLSKNLIAVTYTEKAAKEIKERVFAKILQHPELTPSSREVCIQLASKIFFGTIHAFASKFLKSHCATIGLRSDFEILQNDDEIWQGFLKSFGDVLQILPNEVRNCFLSVQYPDKLVAHGQTCKILKLKEIEKISIAPEINIEPILSYKAKSNETKIKHFLRLFSEWDSFRKNGEFFPMPDYSELCSSQSFVEFCNDELREFLDWKRNIEKFFVSQLAWEYEKFRINLGQLRYDDLINLAVDLLDNPEVIKKVEQTPFRVILDEAQDTDAQQFRFLLGICKKAPPSNLVKNLSKNFPDAGYFSMVGDPQQSIYCGRADVKFYTNLHNSLVKAKAVTELTFSVTMRCSPAITDFVNERFPKIFSDVKFINLCPKQNIHRGDVKVLKISKSEKEDEVLCSAEHVAKFFQKKTLSDFGINQWSDIAILAPRKEWLTDISKCFEKDESLPKTQLYFCNSNNNLASPINWFTSCLRYINNPADKREFAGILREIFGIKSQEIINHFKYDDSVICENIEATFMKLRTQRYSLRLSSFLMKILAELKIFQRIEALQIYSQESLLLAAKQLTELCYFAEINGMNSLAVEDFFVEKNQISTEDENVDDSAIQFVTYHKSKGLEWPAVILPFMFRGRQLKNEILQNFLSKEEQIEALYSNECRLLYVACTRAKNQIIIFDDSEIFDTVLRANMISSGGILLKH